MLTDTAVKKAVRHAKAYKLTDSGGLYVHVMPTGRKFWRCRYEWQGKERVLTFGEYPAMSLVTARGKRDEARLLLREKKDPAVVKKLQQMEDLKEANETFEVLAREWHQSQKSGWVPHHASDVIESLEFHVFPYREHADSVVRALGNLGGLAEDPETARRGDCPPCETAHLGGVLLRDGDRAGRSRPGCRNGKGIVTS